MSKISLTINGRNVAVPEGYTILEAARELQIKIPTLCQHDDLRPSGACGLCVVRINDGQRLLRSCTTPVTEGMKVLTHDKEINEVRRSVLELILSDHPKDCLSCTRNTNCELQTLSEEMCIREEPFPSCVSDLPEDANKSIKIDFNKCIKCGRCVQVCQEIQDVFALSFLNRGKEVKMATVDDVGLKNSPCVGCGQCAAHCPTAAILERDDVEKVREALSDEDNYCTVQIAPSVRFALGEIFGYEPGVNLNKKIYSALRRLGFKAVFDANFSADLTIIEEAAEFTQKFVNTPSDLPLITSCCPAWVDFAERYYPDFIPNLSSAKSPQQMLGAMVKTYFAEKNKLDPKKIVQISIMPCTAKKFELTRSKEMYSSGSQDVDLSITTREFARLLKVEGIDFVNLPEEEADSILGEYSGAGTLFAATGGVMEAALRTAYFNVTGKNLPKEAIDITPVRGLDGIKDAEIDIEGKKIKVAVAHGLANTSKLLNHLRELRKANEPIPYAFIEIMACQGGCIGGGGQPYCTNNTLRKKRTVGIYKEDREKTIRYSHENPEIKRIYNNFLEKPSSKKAHKLLHTTYTKRDLYKA